MPAGQIAVLCETYRTMFSIYIKIALLAKLPCVKFVHESTLIDHRQQNYLT